jgi:hypothetical protein
MIYFIIEFIEALNRKDTVLYDQKEGAVILQESHPTNLWDKSKPSATSGIREENLFPLFDGL